MKPASPPRTPAVLLALIAALVVLGVGPGRVAGGPVHATGRQPGRVREHAGRAPPQSSWEVDGAGDSSIQGYATSMSVNKGQTISFKIKSSTSNYHIDILRLGYYERRRRAADRLEPDADRDRRPSPRARPSPTTGLIDCGNWAVSRVVDRPEHRGLGRVHRPPRAQRHGRRQPDRLRRARRLEPLGHPRCRPPTPPGRPTTPTAATASTSARWPARPATPPPTRPPTRSPTTGPFHTAEDDSGRSWLFTGAEYPMIRFLERNGYDVSYTSSADVGRNPALLQNHKVFMSSGHDEYWSASQRSAVEAARDAGVNLAFFTGNEMFWKTRWEPSADGTNTPGPHARLLQGHALHRRARTPSSGRARGATRASRRRRRTSRRRTR